MRGCITKQIKIVVNFMQKIEIFHLSDYLLQCIPSVETNTDALSWIKVVYS